MNDRLTRREILAAFLGLPAALSACRSKRKPRVPEGEIVGASDRFGHLLRGTPSFTVPADRWSRTSAVIVGGGVAGLAAAWRLKKAGFEDFILLELESAPGGNSRSGSSTVTRFPWGAHYIPAPLKENRALVSLLDEMGTLEGTDEDGEPVVREEFLCRDPQERVFYKGRWYEGLYLYAGANGRDIADLEAFRAEVDRWVEWRDGRGRRAFAVPVSASSSDPEVTALDRISFADWIEGKGWKSRRLRWLLDYSCRDDYGLTIEQTSAWAGLFYLASRMRKAGAQSQPLVSWPEGNGRLASHLYRNVKEPVRLGLAVCDIQPQDPQGGGGLRVTAVDQARVAQGWHADRVIFSAPHFLTRFVIRDYRQRAPQHVASFQYGAWMVANLSLRGRPREAGFPLCWDNVLYESPSLGYITATHQSGRDHGPTVWTYYYPLCDEDTRAARTRLLSTGREQWADVVLADLERPHRDLRDLVERLDVMRWGHAMVQPRPGFIWGGARQAAMTPYRGIHFAHSDLSGVSLFEEAFYHGLRAAEEVLVARGQPFETLL